MRIKWKEFGKKINDIRKLFNLDLPERKCYGIDGNVYDSQAEMRVANFLKLMGIEYKPHVPYKEIFGEECKKNYNCDFGLCGGEVYSEVWGNKKDSSKENILSNDYAITRETKEELFKSSEKKLIGIEWDVINLNKLNEIFKGYIPNDIELKQYELQPNNFKNLIDKIIKIVKENELPPTKIKHLKKNISKVFGNMENLRKILVEKGYPKCSTEYRKKSSAKKCSETKIKNGTSVGKNNPNFGKKGELSPIFGIKKPPEISFEENWGPKVSEFLEKTKDNDKINGSVWKQYAKDKNLASSPWTNSSYNPCIKDKDTKPFFVFIEIGIEYAKNKSIILPEFKYKSDKGGYLSNKPKQK